MLTGCFDRVQSTNHDNDDDQSDDRNDDIVVTIPSGQNIAKNLGGTRDGNSQLNFKFISKSKCSLNLNLMS